MNSNANTNTKIFTANLPITNPSLNGGVVGKGAFNLKRMAMEAGGGFRVQLLNSNKPGDKRPKFSECDTFRLTANSKEALKKGAMILKKELEKLSLEKGCQKQQQKQYQKIVKVDKVNVGKVIGKGGETIKGICRKAHVFKIVYNEDVGGFVITGSKQESLNHAEVLIMGELKKNKTENKTEQKHIHGGFKVLDNAEEVLNKSSQDGGKVELGFMVESKINSLKHERTAKYRVREQMAKTKGVVDWEIRWNDVDAEIKKRNIENAENTKIKSEKLAGVQNEKDRGNLSEQGSFPSFGKVVEKNKVGMWGNGASAAVMSERKIKKKVVVEEKPKMIVLNMSENVEEEEVVIDGWIMDDTQVNELGYGGGGLGKSLMRNVDTEAMEQEQVDMDDMFAGEDEEEEVVIDDWDM